MVTFSTDDEVPALISFSVHPAHDLKLVATGGALFQCDGCKQHGDDERRYRCEPCDFDLHVCCAPLRTNLEHPLFQGCTFAFRHKPPPVPPSFPAGSGWFCDACGDQVLGFVYHDAQRELDLHPQCASLPGRVVEGDGVFDLCKEAPAHGTCGLCEQGQDGHRSRFWWYRYHDGGEPVFVHVACMMETCISRGQIAATTSMNVPTRRTGGLKRFCKVAWKVAKVTYAVTTMDPVAIVEALVCPGE